MRRVSKVESAAGGGRPLARIFLILFVELLGVGILIPALPYYAEGFGADALGVGLLFAAQYAGQFVMSPVWGQLSDRLGRKPVMVVTLGLAAVASLWTALVGSLLTLFLARIFAGLAAGNVSTASAYITDVTEEDERSKGMAIIGISFALGFTLGPGVGAWLSGYGQQVPFWVACGISALNAGLAALVLREPLQQAARRAAQSGQRGQRWALLRQPRTRLMCQLNFLFTIAVSFLEVPFAFYLLDVYHKGVETYGVIMASLGVVMILVQGGLVSRLSAKLGDGRMARAGVAMLALGVGVAPLVESLWWLVPALLLGSAGRGLAQPGMLSLVSQTARQEQRGQVMGLYQSASSLGRVVGPGLGGLLYAQVLPQAPFWGASVLLMAALAMWALSRRGQRGPGF